MYSLISCFWVCCPGLLHESQNKPILAERAILEARRQLRAKEAKTQTQRDEEKKDREEDKEEKNEEEEKDQQEEEEMAMPAYQSPTVNQGQMQRE